MGRLGRFIVFEGIDGTGKTTLSKHVAQEMGALWTREPGASTPFGAEMRRLIMEGDQTATASLFLFAADRQEHLHKVVAPALRSGKDVVCDRYIMSTLTYQSEEWDPTNLKNVARASATYRGSVVLPDVVVIVESNVETILERLGDRGETDGGRYDSVGREVIEQRLTNMRNAAKSLHQLCLLEKHKTAVGCFQNTRSLEEEKDSCLMVVKTVIQTQIDTGVLKP